MTESSDRRHSGRERAGLPLAYTVVATHPSAASADRFEAWLRAGHVEAVLRGGASAASVVRRQGTGNVVEVRYTFSGRERYEQYVREAAPALRAEGLTLFGPDSGVIFERTEGVVVEQWGASAS